MNDLISDLRIPECRLNVAYDGKNYIVLHGDTPDYKVGEIICELDRTLGSFSEIVEQFKGCSYCLLPLKQENIVLAIDEIRKMLHSITGVASAEIIVSEIMIRVKEILLSDINNIDIDLSGLYKVSEDTINKVFCNTNYSSVGCSDIGHVFLSGLAMVHQMFISFREAFQATMERLEKTDDEKGAYIEHAVFENMRLIQAQNIECKIMYIEDKITNVFSIKDITSLLMFELANCINCNTIVKKCKNCGNYFPLYGRKDTVYCRFPSPNDKGKTCKEVGAQVTRVNKEKNELTTKEYRKIYMRLRMMCKRHPENEFASELLERLVSENRKYRLNLENNKISIDEYLKWLKGFEKN